MRGKKIVILSLYKGSSRYSSTIDSLANELSVKNQIYFIDNPSTFKDYLVAGKEPYYKKHRIAFWYGKNRFFPKEENPNFVRVIAPLMLPINWLPRGPLYRMLRRFNQNNINRTIQSVIRNFELKEYIFINSFNPLYTFEFKSGLAPKLRIYHTVDNINESEYISRHGGYMEKKLIATSDFTFVTSAGLADYASNYIDPSDVHLIPNAADFDIFSKALEPSLKRPAELIRVEGMKVVCYIGNIDQRTNFEIIGEILRDKRNVILMIGPEGTSDFKNSGYFKHDRMIYLGAKRMTELPSYLRFVDCAIIPFKCNELTKNIYPLKINEYLAAGKGVVSSDFSPDIRSFQQIIKIAKNAKNFGELVSQVCDTSQEGVADEALRIAYLKVAKKNTWKFRAEQLSDIIEYYLDA